MEMYIKHRQPKRIVQFLALIILALPLSLGAQLFEELFNFGLEVLKIVDEEILEISALTDEQENSIGEGIKQQILSENKVIKSYPKNKNPHKALADLLPHCTRKGIDYDLTIIDSDIFNAYTVAGGKIFVNSTLLKGLQTQEELVFVIAHELAHNELKHCVKKIQHAVFASNIDPNLGEVVLIGYSQIKRPYSKGEEREADEYAINLMRKAGYSKTGGITFFNLLESLEGGEPGFVIPIIDDFISTHPSPQERRARIEKM